MTNKNFLARLKMLAACRDAVKWVEFRDLKQVWAECERIDWLLWLAGRSNIDSKLLVQVAVECAELSLPNYEKQYPNDNRIRDCINTVKRWIKGEASLEDVSTAWSAAESAAESTAWSAESAARSAAWSAESAAESAARSAAWSAESAARSKTFSLFPARSVSAAESAESAAWSAAESAAEKKNLEIIRRIVTYEIIEKALLEQ